MEYYFGDKNYAKDKYLKKRASEREDQFISLKDVMSFNQMRKLTSNPDQVYKALEGSNIVEFSEDKKWVRKIVP